MKKIFIILLVTFILVNLFFLVINSSSVNAFDFKKDSGLQKTAEGTGHAAITTITEGNLPEVIGRIIKMFLSFLGVAFLILMIYGGYTWMIARGNEQQVEKAKRIIIDAIYGLVLVLAAYGITKIMEQFMRTTT